MSEQRRHATFDLPPNASGVERRLRLSEHDSQGFLGVDTGALSHGLLVEPAQLVAIAGEILAIAGSIIERQFRQRLGSP